MSDVQSCLARFSAAALLGTPGARHEARRAIDDLVAGHAVAPLTSISKLYELLDDYRDLKIVSHGGAAIADDIVDRILNLEQAMLARAAKTRATPVKISSQNSDIQLAETVRRAS